MDSIGRIINGKKDDKVDVIYTVVNLTTSEKVTVNINVRKVCTVKMVYSTYDEHEKLKADLIVSVEISTNFRVVHFPGHVEVIYSGCTCKVIIEEINHYAQNNQVWNFDRDEHLENKDAIGNLDIDVDIEVDL